MGYDGIILCDGLGMSGVRDYVGGDKGEVAVRAVMAGNDMLCATDVGVQLRAIVKAVNDGRIELSQIEDSVTRILSPLLINVFTRGTTSSLFSTK